MASIEDGLYSYLSGVSAITTIVGSGSSCRIAPIRMAEGVAFPRIIFQNTNGQPVYADSGDTGLAQDGFHIECQAQTVTGAGSLRNAVQTALSGYKGLMGSSKCEACFIVGGGDVDYVPQHGDETGVKAKSLEVEIHWR